VQGIRTVVVTNLTDLTEEQRREATSWNEIWIYYPDIPTPEEVSRCSLGCGRRLSVWCGVQHRIQLVLFDTHNRTLKPYLATMQCPMPVMTDCGARRSRR
jgi:hypothetical protein